MHGRPREDVSVPHLTPEMNSFAHIFYEMATGVELDGAAIEVCGGVSVMSSGAWARRRRRRRRLCCAWVACTAAPHMRCLGSTDKTAPLN